MGQDKSATKDHKNWPYWSLVEPWKGALFGVYFLSFPLNINLLPLMQASLDHPIFRVLTISHIINSRSWCSTVYSQHAIIHLFHSQSYFLLKRNTNYLYT